MRWLAVQLFNDATHNEDDGRRPAETAGLTERWLLGPFAS